ncbi:MAG: FAD-binding domain-containing protein [Limnobacter sp.]|nr:FAD-binding domain-containing protein [Limnobacter sp.]
MKRITQPAFVASREAALAQLSLVVPDAYAKTRNFLDGAVTYLSPWITHGFLDTREAAIELRKKFELDFEHKMIFELGWREFFRHVHGELGDGILKDIRRPTFNGRYGNAMPLDVLEARTGVQAIDEAVKHLYRTGYLHNHMRMWLASYVVHLRKVHWRTGADWMYAHLLDGDLASNHLSWQWVAGTFSHKPYVFNAENVKKYASHLDCSGTVIDTDYAELGAMAASGRDCGPEENAPTVGIQVPKTFVGYGAWMDARVSNADGVQTSASIEKSELKTKRVKGECSAADLGVDELVSGVKSMQLIHPWDLKACGAVFDTKQSNGGSLKVGVILEEFHRKFPWSNARWKFVMDCMAEHCDLIWVVEKAGLNSVRNTLKDFAAHGGIIKMKECLNPAYAEALNSWPVERQGVETILPNPSMFQQSFSRFYSKATSRAGSLEIALGLEHQS